MDDRANVIQGPELRLLLACVSAGQSSEQKAEIDSLASLKLDWAAFVRKATSHGLAGLAGHTLNRLRPDLLPSDFQDAFRLFIEQTREKNSRLCGDLLEIVNLLRGAGIEPLVFKGPVLAIQAFGDLGLREFRDLDFLIRDRDLDDARDVLADFGYQPSANLSPSQQRLIHHLQGQEILFKPGRGTIEPHTRLISVKMALDIDYEGFWSRAVFTEISGHPVLSFCPEDNLLVLAIHGCKELWWDIKWACDVAHFIAAHPDLDWDTIATRARKQGCYRMLLLTTLIARQFFKADVPDWHAAGEDEDTTMRAMITRIVSRWGADDPGGPPSNKQLSGDRWRLHDDLNHRASYAVRTVFLPGPHHIPLVDLPPSLSWLYIPLGICHDVVALPIYRAAKWIKKQANDAMDGLVSSPLFLKLSRVDRDQRRKLQGVYLALQTYRKRAERDPTDCVAWSVMGDAFAHLKRYKRSIACYDRALALVPDHNPIWRKRADAIKEFRRAEPAARISEEPEVDFNTADGWAIRAGYLAARALYAEAAEAADIALGYQADHEVAARIGINARLQFCDWSKRDVEKHQIKEAIEAGRMIVKPFNHRLISQSEEEHLRLTRIYGKDYPVVPNPLWRGERYRHDKIRIAYLSADFGLRPLGATIVAPIEHHRKEHFEITAISFGAGSGGPLRARIASAVDRFIDVYPLKDNAVANIIRDLEIDIAVDLNGLTGQKRPGILAYRPAPIQVNYLGYPGSMSAPFLDYIIADETVIPVAHHRFYSEKVAYLPHCYLPYDTSTEPGRPLSRSQYGLPETGFLFASFNNLSKLSPEMFSVWMRLLHSVEGSAIWMQNGSATAKQKLRDEARNRGIDPTRIVFAGFEEQIEHHLARLTLADLFLDSLPYNAHTTACDALWAGVPVLTCLGTSFQSRVAASALLAAGLPELVTSSTEQYEQLALLLCKQPDVLEGMRRKLAANRLACALFDMPLFTRNLEQTYLAMWKRREDGLPPAALTHAGVGELDLIV